MARRPYLDRDGGAGRAIVATLVVLGVGHVVLFAVSSQAQSNSPKSFYKKDYAIAPGAKGRDDVQLPANSFQQGGGRGGAIQPVSQSPGQSTSANAQKRRILISLYVNSADKQHLNKVIEEALTLNDEKRAFVVSIHHIGDYQNVSQDMEAELAKRKIQLLAVSELPSNVHATVSPTWIIQTQQGTHIAEGIIDIHSYLNEYGEYDPKRRNDPHFDDNVEGF